VLEVGAFLAASLCLVWRYGVDNMVSEGSGSVPVA